MCRSRYSNRTRKNRLSCDYDEAHVGIIQLMKQKSSYSFNSVITAIFLLFPAAGRADFICSADISYKWERVDRDENTEEKAISNKDNKNGTAAPVAPTQPAVKEAPSHVRYATVERGGADEAGAKTLLGMELSRQKARASDRCKREHESFGECLATKLSVKGTVLNSLSFSARTQLERAITEECQLQQGTCLAVESTEPVCREVAKPDKSGKGPAVEVSSGADGKKSDAAGDKRAEAPPSAKAEAKGKAPTAKK